VKALIEHCGNELAAAPFIQTAQAMAENQSHFAANEEILGTLLEQLESRTVQ
jgi:hypothetical protein